MKKYIFKHKNIFIKALILIILSSLMQLSFDFFKGLILDLSIEKKGSFLYYVGLIYIGAVLLKALTHFLYTKYFNKGRIFVMSNLRFDFFKGLLKKSYPEFRKTDTGHYINKYSNEFSLIEQLLFQSIYSMLQTVTEMIFALIGFFIIDFQLAIIAFVLISISISIPFAIKNWVAFKNKSMLEFMARHISKVKNYFYGYEVIYNYKAFKNIHKEFEKSNRFLYKKKIEYINSVMASQYISKLFSQISLLIIMGFSIYLIREGTISVGRFITATNILISIQSMTTYVATNIQNILTSKVSTESVKEISEFETEKNLGNEIIGEVEKVKFDKIHFYYNNNREIFRDFDFDASTKGTYFIQGKSGSGKSTLMNLLLRYNELNGGKILLNNFDINEIKNLNSKFSIMRQEASFFEDTLRENIRVYDESISDHMIIEYMNKLGLEKFGNKESLDKVIKNNGMNFSGGERRRLSFIRTILKQADIIILDEPFANVDEETMTNIAKMINNIENCFVFLISHQIPKSYKVKFEKIILLK